MRRRRAEPWGRQVFALRLVHRAIWDPLERGTLKFVMDTSPARTYGVNQALVESVPLVASAHSEGFAELYERTFPRVYAYVASLLRDRAAAEDVTSQAFERPTASGAANRPARGSMDAWLFGIARNAALDELRKRKRRRCSRSIRRTRPRPPPRTRPSSP